MLRFNSGLVTTDNLIAQADIKSQRSRVQNRKTNWSRNSSQHKGINMENLVERQNDTGISTRIPLRTAEQLALVARDNGRTVADEIRHVM
jgi:hypothetical protein